MTAESSGYVLAPNLNATIAELLASPELARAGRATRTVAHHGPLRIVLLVLRSGGRLAEHHAPGALSLHALKGRLTVIAGDEEPLELTEGALLVLPPNLKHEVAAAEDSAVLLTIVGPP